MACHDVPDLVPQHARQLGLVAGQRQQPAGDVDVAAGQREGVDHVAVEKPEGELLLLERSDVLQPLADAGDILLELGVPVEPAELGQHLLVLLAPDLGLLGRAHEDAVATLLGAGRGCRSTGQRRHQK